MAFQFTKPSGKLYTMNEIDHIAAASFGKVSNRNYWATPFNKGCAMNWFDIIGHAVEDVQYRKWQVAKDGSVEWHNVRANILHNCIYAEKNANYKESIDFLMPFLKLCDTLEELGVRPIALGW